MICKMSKDPEIGVFWKLLFGTVTFLSFALPVISDWSEMVKTTCPDGFGLNYTLPMFKKCEMKRLQDGSMVQSIPKRIPVPSVGAGCNRGKNKEGIPGGYNVCRMPDCRKNLCRNSWCEETMVGYNCHCSSGFQGRHCDEQLTESLTTDATTKPTMSPTTTMSDTSTSQGTTTSKSRESSTTIVTTKPTTNPTTTISDTTTYAETTTSTCSGSSPLNCKYGGSFYNFSKSEVTHASAVSACSQYGSHLVFIVSQEEQDFIAGVASEDSWIGVTGPSESDARWLDGSSLSYSNFESGSFDGNGKCFRIKKYCDYCWHDMNCSRKYRFICEKEVGL